MTATDEVKDNQEASRFELQIEDQTAFLNYQRTDGALALIHTEVPEAFRGRHIGERLVVAALEAGRAAGLRIVAICPFVRAYLRKHPEAGHDS